MFDKIHNYAADSDVQAAVDMTTADVDVGVADPRLRQLRAGNVGRK